MENNTFSSTNSLKGIAIIAVLINHYLNLNVQGDSTGFANLWIVVFFILSGYGIQYSLSSRFNDERISLKIIFNFYYSRIIRILPLFWIAYLIESFLFGYDISILTLLGISGVGHYWFVPAIIQCYLLAPIIYLLARKNRVAVLIVILLAFVFLNWMISLNIFPIKLIDVLKKIHLYWRNVFFLYLLVFFFSMLLPRATSQWSKITYLEKNFYFYLIISIVMLLMLSVKYKAMVPYLHILTTDTIVPVVLIIISSVYLVCNRMVIPYVSKIGSISYSIYLFHMIFYLFIKKYLIYDVHFFFEIGVYIMLFPVFLYLCFKLEKFSYYLTKFAKVDRQSAQTYIPLGLV